MNCPVCGVSIEAHTKAGGQFCLDFIAVNWEVVQ